MGTEWLNKIFIADSFAELRQSIENVIPGFGFRYFMFHARFPNTAAGNNDVYFDNCPEGWGGYYRERRPDGLLRLSPKAQLTPMLWRQISPLAPELFAKAREFGLVAGSTHPVHGPGGQWSSMSFIKDREGAKAEKEIEDSLAKCQLTAGYVHDCAARILERRLGTTMSQIPAVPRDTDLNERECQVLTWAAAGKTASETATILSIAERTVLFYLASARQKLGATNSRHAISKALSQGLIDPARIRGTPGIALAVFLLAGAMLSAWCAGEC
jgi:LuxR family transcriptional activator of conjugal transfer of Ti plasmids